MIIPNKHLLRISDNKRLNKLFLRFIDTIDIELECPNDVLIAIELFAKIVESQLREGINNMKGR